MQIGFIGLGRMGGNMVKALLQDGHEVVVYDNNPQAIKNSMSDGAVGSDSLQMFVSELNTPRTIWVMVPAGNPTEQTLQQLMDLCQPGDLIIDGGNSNFHDSKRRAKYLNDNELHFCDIGVSGGIWGLKVGYCMMAGGDQKDIQKIKSIENFNYKIFLYVLRKNKKLLFNIQLNIWSNI